MWQATSNDCCWNPYTSQLLMVRFTHGRSPPPVYAGDFGAGAVGHLRPLPSIHRRHVFWAVLGDGTS